MLKELLNIAYPDVQRPPPDINDYVGPRKVGRILMSIFAVSIVLYKFYLPNNYLFLFSWGVSVIGFPLYFIPVINMFYIERGLELSNGRSDAYTIPKFFNLIGNTLALVAGIVVPILVKVYLI